MNTTLGFNDFGNLGSNLFGMLNFIFGENTGGDTHTDDQRSPKPKEMLLEYVYEAVPELVGEDIEKLEAWECSVPPTKTPKFKVNTIVVWNDEVIPATHPARVHTAKGSLVVRVADDFIVGFSRAKKCDPFVTEIPEERITLEASDGRYIIAHPGYFKLSRE